MEGLFIKILFALQQAQGIRIKIDNFTRGVQRQILDIHIL